MSEDTKLLMSVAAVVVFGAVGIALVAGRTARSPADEAESLAAREPARPAYAATPAAYEVPAPPVEPIETPIELDVEPPETGFRIEPGENLVARGLETYEARRFEEAVAYFAAEVAERPDNAWTHYMLGLAQWKSGSLDQAGESMRRSLEIDAAGIRAWTNLARIENARGESAAALEAAHAAIAIDDENPSARFVEARSLFNLDRRDEALRSVRTSLDLDPSNGYAHNLEGLILIEQGLEQQAVPSLRRAAELEPDVAFIANNLGMALERSGDASEALAWYRRAVELDAGHAHAAANLARLEPLVPVEPSEAIVVAEAAAADDADAEP